MVLPNFSSKTTVIPLLRCAYCLLLVFLSAFTADAQSSWYQFRRLTPEEGLNEGTIRSFTQDKYGYMWIGTFSGLNRYDGYRVRQYLSQAGDTTGLWQGPVDALYCTGDGQLLAGQADGISLYDPARDVFVRMASTRGLAIEVICGLDAGRVYLGTSAGVYILTVAGGKLEKLPLRKANGAAWDAPVLALSAWGPYLYVGARGGLLRYNLHDRSQRYLRLEQPRLSSVESIAVTVTGDVWFTTSGLTRIHRTDTGLVRHKRYDEEVRGSQFINPGFFDILVDRRQRVWVGTITDGLCEYDSIRDVFISHRNDPLHPGSPLANHVVKLYEDRQGIIWAGTEGYGVNFFHPDKALFQHVIPRGADLSNGLWSWARALAVDRAGNWWMATAGGIFRYHPNTGRYEVWRNDQGESPVISYNSVRGVLADEDNVWILTGGGVDRYELNREKMIPNPAGDSLPGGFYFTGLRARDGTLWIGGRDYDGLYYKKPGQHHFTGAASDPVLKTLSRQGVRSLWEDRKGRLWIGFLHNGVAVYDPANKSVRHWGMGNGTLKGPIGRNVTGITEDLHGRIWLSTEAGLSELDPSSGNFRHYTTREGLPALRTSCVRADGRDRIWVGTSRGLAMLDSTRRNFRIFDRQDGLPVIDFADMPSQVLPDGRFVFSSMSGFVIFRPEAIEDRPTLHGLWMTSLDVNGKPYQMSVQPETLEQLSLRADENFLRIELAALNLLNPSQTWYAYKLEGFDKDWIVTRDHIATYTNLPGGQFVFRYKAATDPSFRDAQEKKLAVRIARVFYKTSLFWWSLAVLTALAGYAIYRYRLRNQQRVYLLQSKTQLLEKEKALVMYESLKQQLNPHFLFNSLTSLSSLIQHADKKSAAGFLDNLSKTYRYILKSRDHETVPLSDEVKFAENYVRLQQTRFEKGFGVHIDLPAELLDHRIVPVTLQNLIENALKHNVVDEESPLRIRVFAEDGYLLVQNNLQRKNFVETSNRQGLDNLRSLYRYLSNRPLLVEEDNRFFTVKIPLL